MKGADASTPDVATGAPRGAGRADTRGRFPTESPPPFSDFGLGRLADRNFDVEWAAGAPVSTVWAGRWARGSIVRQAQPAFVLAPATPMYDPTDPANWRPQGA